MKKNTVFILTLILIFFGYTPLMAQTATQLQAALNDSISKSKINKPIPDLPQAKSIVLQQTNENGIYKKGENIKVRYYSKDTKTDSVFVKLKKNFSKTELRKFKYTGDSLVIFNEIGTEPVAYIFEANTRTETASIGLIVEPASFKPSTDRPKDFDSFWKKEKKALSALTMTIKSTPVSIKETDYSCSDIELNCTGPMPARGYFAKPVSSKPRSLPIVIYFHWAAVNPSLPDNALRYAKMGNGALGFDLNAHGILNGQPAAYYEQLAKGTLNNYPFKGIEHRDSCYFKGMYLRLLRTIEFLTRQPEWDGKRIVVIGESQGGGQAFAAAGLDKRVSLVMVTAPAMCNWGGTLVGSKGSWPYPFESKIDRAILLNTMPYYDAAHVLKGSKATIVAELGLIDQSCPSSNVYAALNQAKGKKIILTVPYRGHHMDQPAYKEIWDTTINKTKEAFLEDYLK